LYFSALVEVAVPQEGRRAQGEAVLDLASLSLVAALAIRAALQSFAVSELRVKWPNDIVTAKGKLVGISLELKQSHAVFPGSLPFGTAGAAGVPVPVQAPALAPTLAPTLATASHYAVIGVGINVKRPSEGAFEGAAYLDDDATEQLPFDKIAQEAINTLLDRYEKWAGGHGLFAPFTEEYHAHMTLLGESVCVRDATGTEIAQGAVEGVDEKGQLLLAGEAGLVAVTAGEVTLRNPRAPSCCSGR
jgi:BirA family biotin operon repressor/biotin-[acetyl-CoA-carboxylase] ligase